MFLSCGTSYIFTIPLAAAVVFAIVAVGGGGGVVFVCIRLHDINAINAIDE